MTRFTIVLLFTFSFFSNSFSQSNLNDYSYVVVPESFEFLAQRDEYQLNSLTKHLFNSNGFNAFLNTELPDVRRCDGLWADVEGSLGFIYTKIVVVVKDCNGNELFRSEEGKSKIKAFNRTYHDALRKAFRSIAALHVSQKEVEIFGKDDENPTQNVKVEKEKRDENANTDSGVRKASNVSSEEIIILPKEKFSSYNRGERSYLLRKTNTGFSLYEENETVADGLMLVGEIDVIDGLINFKLTTGETYDAKFDTTGNLIVTMGKEIQIYKKSL